MLLIDSNYKEALKALGLSSVADIKRFFAHTGETLKPGVSVRQRYCNLSEGEVLSVFYKQYEYDPAALSFLGRRSKARCEFENYALFARLGVRCAEPIACGEQRDPIGRLRNAFIITRAIPGAKTLAEFIAQHCPHHEDPSHSKLRAGLRAQLATMTRQIHDAGFFHNDLVWRNILVTWQPPEKPILWWIDCPRGRFVFRKLSRRRRRLKDLALLDKSASSFCTRKERLAFVKEYLGKKGLDAEMKDLICRTVDYDRKRWPKDADES